MKQVGEPISDSEWLMYKRCNGDDVAPCYYYEYARENNEARHWIGKLKAGMTIEELKRHGWRQMMSEFPKALYSSFAGRLIFHCREFFPDTPWLDLPTETRQDAKKQFYAVCHIKEIPAINQSDYPMFFEKFDEHKHLIPDGHPIYNYAIRIDMSAPDTIIKSEFSKFLKQQRRRNIEPEETRGRPQTAKIGLKQLAALRLLRAKKIIQHAMDYSEIVNQNRLYAAHREFEKSANAASERISVFMKSG